MDRRVMAALGRWLTRHRDALCSLLWIVANMRQVLVGVQVLVDMNRHGGSVVNVPSDAPVISTLVQLDGDFVTSVDRRIFTDGRSPEARSALIAQHADALRAHLCVVGDTFGTHIAGCALALRDVAVAGWITMEAWGSSTQGDDWHALLGNFAGVAWATLRPLLLWQAVAIGIPALLHFATPLLLRLAIHRASRQ